MDIYSKQVLMKQKSESKLHDKRKENEASDIAKCTFHPKISPKKTKAVQQLPVQ